MFPTSMQKLDKVFPINVQIYAVVPLNIIFSIWVTCRVAATQQHNVVHTAHENRFIGKRQLILMHVIPKCISATLQGSYEPRITKETV